MLFVNQNRNESPMHNVAKVGVELATFLQTLSSSASVFFKIAKIGRISNDVLQAMTPAERAKLGIISYTPLNV